MRTPLMMVFCRRGTGSDWRTHAKLSLLSIELGTFQEDPLKWNYFWFGKQSAGDEIVNLFKKPWIITVLGRSAYARRLCLFGRQIV